jgi:hypothetical protein
MQIFRKMVTVHDSRQRRNIARTSDALVTSSAEYSADKTSLSQPKKDYRKLPMPTHKPAGERNRTTSSLNTQLSERASLAYLPNELKLKIIKNLEVGECINLANTNRFFRNYLLYNKPLVKEHILDRVNEVNSDPIIRAVIELRDAAGHPIADARAVEHATHWGGNDTILAALALRNAAGHSIAGARAVLYATSRGPDATIRTALALRDAAGRSIADAKVVLYATNRGKDATIRAALALRDAAGHPIADVRAVSWATGRGSDATILAALALRNAIGHPIADARAVRRATYWGGNATIRTALALRDAAGNPIADAQAIRRATRRGGNATIRAALALRDVAGNPIADAQAVGNATDRGSDSIIHAALVLRDATGNRIAGRYALCMAMRNPNILYGSLKTIQALADDNDKYIHSQIQKFKKPLDPRIRIPRAFELMLNRDREEKKVAIKDKYLNRSLKQSRKKSPNASVETTYALKAENQALRSFRSLEQEMLSLYPTDTV